MILAAHQPAFLPWLGYLDKMAKADVFVVMDDLPCEPDRFQDRQRIKSSDGDGWLVVPVQHGRSLASTRIDPDAPWRRRTWHAIEAAYERAPGFPSYADDLREALAVRWDHLIDLDLATTELARAWLGIRTPIIRASTLRLRGATLSERLIDACRAVGADRYLSGSGASTTSLDVAAFERAGIRIVRQDFVHPIYSQQHEHRGFVSNLAALDFVFNHAPRRRRDTSMKPSATTARPAPPLPPTEQPPVTSSFRLVG